MHQTPFAVARRARRPLASLLPAVAAAATLLATACGGPAPTAATSADATRGRYLVERASLCTDCHSPRDEQGRFVADRWLMGSALPFAATVPMPWAPAAPPIAGLPGLTDDQAITFLQTGELPGGRKLRPPMPEWRFDERDARDIVAYLRHPIAPAAAQ